MSPANSATTSEWWFLGVHVTELTVPQEAVVVAEAVLPEGASPPLHAHADLDDSFYVLDGTMVVRCGREVTVAGPGAWIRFPRQVPHTFRVMSSHARVLIVHASRTFIDAVHAIGSPGSADRPMSTPGPAPDVLRRVMAEHGMRTVGPSMEEVEARSWLEALGRAPAGGRDQDRDGSRP